MAASGYVLLRPAKVVDEKPAFFLYNKYRRISELMERSSILALWIWRKFLIGFREK